MTSERPAGTSDRPAGTTRDAVLGGRVTLIQPRAGYRAAIDPILLAASVDAHAGDVVVDLGCGVGTAGLCLAVRSPGVSIIGLEKQTAYALLAGLGAAATGVQDRMAIVAGCVGAGTMASGPIAPGTADRVMTNPPYAESGHGRSPRADRAMSMAEGDIDLRAWIAAAHRLLKPRGWLSIIHRADRIADIIATLAPRFGAIAIHPIYSRHGDSARRVIVHARRDVKSPASIAAGLVLHEADGGFTPAALRILNDAQPLEENAGRR